MNVTKLTKRIGSLLFAGMLMLGAQVYAQSTIIQTYNFSDQLTGGDPTVYNIDFSKFDSSAGTLQSVTLSLTDLFVTGTASVTNNTGSTHLYTIQLLGDYTFTDGVNFNEVIVNGPSKSGAITNGSTLTTDVGTNPVAGSVTSTLTDNTSLSLYTGTGSTLSFLQVDSGNNVSVSGSAPYSTTANSYSTGTFTLTYTYTPVPEPGTTMAWMLAFGVCVLFGRRFFRRSV